MGILFIGTFLIYFVCVIGFFAIIGTIMSSKEQEAMSQMSPAQRKRHIEKKRGSTLLHGPLNSALKCPHCDEKGGVHTKPTDKKNGISGAKATGALLTGGISLLATGLSQKEKRTEAYCVKCDSTWIF